MLKAISLFTGVGGLDLGFEAAGFETTVAVEMDAVCCRTLRLNRPWPVIEGDVHEVTSETLLKTGKLLASGIPRYAEPDDYRKIVHPSMWETFLIYRDFDEGFRIVSPGG